MEALISCPVCSCLTTKQGIVCTVVKGYWNKLWQLVDKSKTQSTIAALAITGFHEPAEAEINQRIHICIPTCADCSNKMLSILSPDFKMVCIANEEGKFNACMYKEQSQSENEPDTI